MRERWKEILITDGRYSVSNTGKVKNNKTDHILVPRPTRNGYQRVSFKFDGKDVDYYVHRLVADAFCKKKKDCNVVNHLDNDVSNNIYTNLEWTTQANNVRYAMSQKRMPGFPNARKVIGIINGKEREFVSSNEAARVMHCDPKGVSNCCNGKKHTHHGYTWRWAEEG